MARRSARDTAAVDENAPAAAQTAARTRRAAKSAAPPAVEAPSAPAPRPRARRPRADPAPAVAAVPAELTQVERRTPSNARIMATLGGLVALVLIVAVVLATVFWLSTRNKLSDSDQLSRARDSALASAKTYAVDLFTYNYQTLDADFARVLNEATGDFKSKFSGASLQLGPAIKQAQAKSTATVTAAGIASATLDTVVVDLFVDQTVTNTSTPTPRIDRSRVEMTLKANGSGWLVAQIDVK